MCWEVQRDQDGRGHYDPPKSLALRLPHSTGSPFTRSVLLWPKVCAGCEGHDPGVNMPI